MVTVLGTAVIAADLIVMFFSVVVVNIDLIAGWLDSRKDDARLRALIQPIAGRNQLQINGSILPISSSWNKTLLGTGCIRGRSQASTQSNA